MDKSNYPRDSNIISMHIPENVIFLLKVATV